MESHERQENRYGYKIDGIFAECFTKLTIEYWLYVFAVLLNLVFLVYFRVSQSLRRPDPMDRLMISNTFFAVIPLGILLLTKIYVLIFGMYSVKFAVDTAAKIGNSVQTEPILGLSPAYSECVSQEIFISRDQIRFGQQVPGHKRKQTTKSIKSQIFFSFKFVEICGEAMVLAMLGFTIYSLVFQFSPQVNQLTLFQRIVFLIFSGFWIFLNYAAVIAILAIGLSPLILVGVCIYVCVKGPTIRNQSNQRNQNRSSLKIPQAHKLTLKQIDESGGACSICLTDFQVNDNVITVPCEGKHIFHELCLNGWLNFKATCPYCRTNLRNI